MKEETEKKPVAAEDQPLPEGKMYIKVYAPFHNYYEGVAESISGINATGPFDILKGHHKFMSLLSPCELEVRDNGEITEKIKIDRGVMYVKEDRVTVFLDV